jgi:hypothetical protein
MFTAKAAVAALSFGLGASAMALAVYSQNPKAFTSPVPAPLPAVEAPNTKVATLPVPDTVDEPLMSLPAPKPPPVRHRAPPQASPPVETEILPCSGWHDMASGPDGRRVRYLCDMAPPEDAPRPGS